MMRARPRSPRTGQRRGSWPPLSLTALALLLALGACSTPAQLPAAGPSGGAASAAPAPPASGAPAAAPAAPSGGQAGAPGAAGAAQVTDWDTTVAAARQEGQVVCGCPAIPVIRELLASEFAAAFPGIQLETTPALPPDWSARVQT